jgi:hypothetical protein
MHRFIGALTTKGTVSLSRRRLATKVWVIQCPKGALQRSRWPFGQRPRRRVILVVVPVSSMRLKPHARLACGGPFLARRFDVETILLARQQSFLKR